MKKFEEHRKTEILDKVKRELLKKGISLKDIAREMKMEYHSFIARYNEYKKGERTPSEEWAMQFCDITCSQGIHIEEDIFSYNLNDKNDKYKKDIFSFGERIEIDKIKDERDLERITIDEDHLRDESLKNQMRIAISSLSRRENGVIVKYFGLEEEIIKTEDGDMIKIYKGPLSLEEIGMDYGITRERARQIQKGITSGKECICSLQNTRNNFMNIIIKEVMWKLSFI